MRCDTNTYKKHVCANIKKIMYRNQYIKKSVAGLKNQNQNDKKTGVDQSQEYCKNWTLNPEF